MTEEQVKSVLDRVLSWPRERQEEAAQMLLALEAHDGEFYDGDDEEWAAVEEGYQQAIRGELASEAEVAAVLTSRH